MTFKKSVFIIFAKLLLLCFSSEGMTQPQIWSIDGSYRLRAESLQNTFRADKSGDDQILVSRFLLSFKINTDNVFAELEIQDSRAWLDDSSTPLGIDDVNTIEPLQAWVGWRQKGKYAIKAGRQTLDLGSRRLVARNRFRNTINAFDGFYGNYQHNAWHWQAFYFLPVQRLPNDRNELDNNDIRIDKQGDDKFWGLHIDRAGKTNLEFYYYNLDGDSNGLSLSTIGFRSTRTAAVHQVHYGLETAYQSGEKDSLDINAAMLHLHIGYQFADVLSSRIELMFDYASGDDNPNDDEINSFNTLFGARRFEFGPTGIHGAFARTNIISPGLKWLFTPIKNNAFYVAYRAIWLESPTDQQSSSGLRDSNGNSGRFAGHQLEARWRLDLSKPLQLEIGGAYLWKGDFLKNAPKAPDSDNTTFLYSQITYKF